MHPNMLPTFSLLVIASLTLIHIPQSFCQDLQYVICGEPFRCGKLYFNYPFWGGIWPIDCGYPGFELTCQNSVAFLTFESVRYRVLDIDGSKQSLTVARDDLWSSLCPRFIHDTKFNYSIFSYSSGYQNVTLSYDCTIRVPTLTRPPNQFDCTVNTTTATPNFFSTTTLGINPTDVGCNSSLSVPVKEAATPNLGSSAALQAALKDGFGIRWEANNSICDECTRSSGRCGYNFYSNSFACYCSDRTCNNTRVSNGSSGLPRSVIPILVGSLGTIVLILSIAGMFYLVKRRSSCKAINCSSCKAINCSLNSSSCKAINCSKADKENNKNVEALLRNYGSLAPKCYSYSDIKKMTGSFAHQLGQGGYGSVYKGKLSDGRQVAVKVMRDNKGDGQEFINEVASISRTSHVNVVTLLGFCYKGSKRALIYEFLSNGSLDKFICKNESQDADSRLEWKVLYQIALGTARGLEYLHRGCNTRIVHFDIKPQNILLDKDFCPKIADFGLAKLCEKKQSILSTMGARGTPGYIAPEVFYRCFGGVSHKSDVYSYGMVVLEMVGLKSRIQVDTQKSSETYFPDWIYERLELEKDLGLADVMKAEEEEDARKMILVGLWCIQPKPSDRPSMSKVVEMLEGSIQSLQIPPKPYLLDSPAAIRSFQDSSGASLS